MVGNLTVVSVLKSGGEYKPEHVLALQAMCQRFLPAHKFVCLTDRSIPGCECVSLKHDWPGWWSKMELFSLRPPILYFDLDTVLVDDCTSIVSAAGGHPFIILRDVYRGKLNQRAMQSSIMYWEEPLDFLSESFRSSPDFVPGGDQIVIERLLLERNYPVAYWQDITDAIVSFKADHREQGARPGDRIIIFHGKPRPWEQNTIDYQT
jgi:hypothetical protein